MNFCKNCKNTFTDTELKQVKGTFEEDYGVSGLFDTKTEYVKYICPNCFSDDIEEAYKCKNCEEYFLEEELEENLCKQCYDDLK